jgi:uncharacterized protein YjbI with pentapeptide repeats
MRGEGAMRGADMRGADMRGADIRGAGMAGRVAGAAAGPPRRCASAG